MRHAELKGVSASLETVFEGDNIAKAEEPGTEDTTRADPCKGDAEAVVTGRGGATRVNTAEDVAKGAAWGSEHATLTASKEGEAAEGDRSEFSSSAGAGVGAPLPRGEAGVTFGCLSATVGVRLETPTVAQLKGTGLLSATTSDRFCPGAFPT